LYGIEKFKFEIIEECEEKQLDEREIYWIDYFDSFFMVIMRVLVVNHI